MSDIVLASIPRARLSVALTAFHRNGFGHVIRVLDPDRAPIDDQLRRAGISSSRFRATSLGEAVLIFVHAPERTTLAASLAVTGGATDVEVTQSGLSVAESAPLTMIGAAGQRRGRRINRRNQTPPDSQPLQLAD